MTLIQTFLLCDQFVQKSHEQSQISDLQSPYNLNLTADESDVLKQFYSLGKICSIILHSENRCIKTVFQVEWLRLLTCKPLPPLMGSCLLPTCNRGTIVYGEMGRAPKLWTQTLWIQILSQTRFFCNLHISLHDSFTD